MEDRLRKLESLRTILDGFNAHDLDESHGDFVEGDRGVSEWTLSGTTTEGVHIEVRGCDLWTFTPDGRIAVKNSFWKIRE